MLLLSNLRRRLKRSLPDLDIRSQIARDLHDGVIQDLVAFGYTLDSIIARPDLTPSLRSEIRRVRLDATDIVRKLREDIFQLRRISHEVVAELAELFVGSSIEFQALGEFPALRDDELREIRSLFREVALNSIRHSQAKSFTLQSELYNDHWLIKLSDDGVGRATITSQHFGLQSIKERVTSLGGELTMESSSVGTHYRILFPRHDIPNKYDSHIGSGRS
mgnify:CR=1 FL=1